MKNIEFMDGKVIFSDMPKPKKITGTRFGAVLNANDWQSPFQAWCEITKAWCKPFDGDKYTEAGKIIESKQLDWFSRYLPIVRPEDVYGADPFGKTYGDFFKGVPVFGGMWDALTGTKDNATGVIECKTTKRSEDWKNDVPEYYALQASLYAFLLGLDDVYMIVTFLDDGDYEHPEDFVCNADNTTYINFKVSVRYPQFQTFIDYCHSFWNKHILTGISPEYDEERDKEYLDALRTNVITDDADVSALVEEAESLYAKIEAVKATMAEDEKRLKDIENMLKKYAKENSSQDETKVVFKGHSMVWTVSRSEKKSVDVDKLKKDGMYDAYSKTETSYTIRKAINKDKDGEEE